MWGGEVVGEERDEMRESEGGMRGLGEVGGNAAMHEQCGRRSKAICLLYKDVLQVLVSSATC